MSETEMVELELHTSVQGSTEGDLIYLTRQLLMVKFKEWEIEFDGLAEEPYQLLAKLKKGGE